jgi:hypothetical protein
MRNNIVAEAELAIARHMLSTSFMDVSSPATFWAWLHNKWLPHLNHYRSTFPPSGVLLYDMRQRPVIGAYGNAYIARPRPLEDPLKSDSNAALWGVGMVLRQHRVRMSNCSAALAAVDSLAPPEQREPSSAAETMRAGKCYEKTQLSWSDSWELTQYTTAVRLEFSVRECAQGCAELAPNGCSSFVTADGDGLLTARYTDAAVSGAHVPADGLTQSKDQSNASTPLLSDRPLLSGRLLRQPSTTRQVQSWLASQQAHVC